MDISNLNDKLFKYTASSTSFIKDRVSWGSRYVESEFSKTIITKLTKLWILAERVTNTALQCMYKSPFLTFSVSGAFLVLGFIAFKISQSYLYQENRFAKTTWKSIGAAAFLTSTATATLGIILISA